MKPLRRLECSDHDAVREVYREAVESCCSELYTADQRAAWAHQSGSATLLSCLQRGQGLVSCAANGTIAAFAVREPADRIALLYCRPAHQHQGHAGRLLLALEQDARQEGIARLRTEASFLSRALFRRQGWQPSWQEELLINGIHFRRFRLHKPLQPILS
jgi:putative acetyltransferase